MEKEISYEENRAYIIRHIADKMLEMRVLFNKETGQLVANFQRCLIDQSVSILDMVQLGTRLEMWSCIVNARYLKASRGNWPMPIPPIWEAIGYYLIEFVRNVDVVGKGS